jgi:hypothetical protein
MKARREIQCQMRRLASLKHAAKALGYTLTRNTPPPSLLPVESQVSRLPRYWGSRAGLPAWGGSSGPGQNRPMHWERTKPAPDAVAGSSSPRAGRTYFAASATPYPTIPKRRSCSPASRTCTGSTRRQPLSRNTDYFGGSSPGNPDRPQARGGRSCTSALASGSLPRRSGRTRIRTAGNSRWGSAASRICEQPPPAPVENTSSCC